MKTYHNREQIQQRIQELAITNPPKKAKKMLCGAKLRSRDVYCQKHTLLGKTRCRNHGGASLSGQNHPNWKHGWCTKESRQRAVETNARIKLLKQIAVELGMVERRQ